MKKHLYTGLIVCTTFLVLSACNSSKPWYHKKVVDWQLYTYAEEKVNYKVFLIGDCGKPSSDPLEPSFVLLREELIKAGNKSAVVFLGDNIYNAGLLPVDHPDRKESLRRIDTQLDILKDYQGKVVYVPGNHDWNNNKEGGWEAIKREENYIEKELDQGNTFRPDDGCSGPSVIDLTDNTILIAYDSQWWLHEHDKPGKKEGCLADNHEEFVKEMEKTLQENKDKNIILASHHPMYTNGTHGGHFPWYEHLFPLTFIKKYLYIPLPVFGSVYVFSRQLGVSNQDVGNKLYKSLRRSLIPVFSEHKGLIHATGHEHSLQYFPKGDQHYIVSGSGTKANYTVKGHGAEFTYAKKGFSVLNYLQNGEVWMEFISPDEVSNEKKIVFRKKLK